MCMKLTTRGWVVLWVTVGLVMSLFTYATRDVCFVGNMPGNFYGYGSCKAMIDLVVTP
jgi:hypothetical protein